MAAKYKTSLSVGADIRAELLRDPDVSAITTNIYPIWKEKAVLPYIVYRRGDFEQQPVKAGYREGSDTVMLDVVCYGRSYAESIEMAEAVRHALDNRRDRSIGISAITLSGSEETYQDDAFAQLLTFKINF